MKAVKSLALAALMFFFVIPSFSQSELVYSEDLSDWKTYQELNGVVISYKIIEYHDDVNDEHREIYVLRFTNTSSEKMRVDFKKTIWYDGECFNCDKEDEEYNISFNLLGSEEIQGDPVEKKYNRLLFFKKFLNYPDISEVTKFELKNLEIKPL